MSSLPTVVIEPHPDFPTGGTLYSNSIFVVVELEGLTRPSEKRASTLDTIDYFHVIREGHLNLWWIEINRETS